MFRPGQIAGFLVAIGIVVRLLWINQPYIDKWSWRQSDVGSMARNFYNKGFHLAHPQIDWAGDQPGYVGTEFPILPFAAAISYRVVGVHEWVGRMQGIIFFGISAFFFFYLVRRIVSDQAAVWAVFFYSFAPLSVFTSREFIPDTPSLSLSVIGLYFFTRWIDSVPTGKRRWAFFIASVVCVAASVLIKLPSVLIGVPLACLVLRRFGFSSFQKPELWLFAVIALCPSAVWYWHAHEIAGSYYPYHFFGAGGVRLMSLHWYFRITRELILSSLTWPLFLAGLIGLWLGRSASRLHLFYWWLAAMIIFTIAVGYGNRHQWYQLAFVPIAAVFAGVACVSITHRISSPALRAAISAAIVALFLGCGFFAIKPLYRSPASAALRELGLALKSLTPRGSLFVAADIGDPTAFYYSERTGWHLLERHGVFQGEPLSSDQAISNLNQLRAQGANYLVFTWATVWWLDYYKDFAQYVQNNSVLVEATPEFRIYQLNHK